MSIYFDSKDQQCKNPFGAVLCGTEVSFSLLCSREEDICAGVLRLRAEFAGLNRTVPLTPSGGAWRCTVTAPEEPDLLWYDFTLTRGSGETVSLTRNGGPWQLTVYEDTGTPEWFGQGVSYQIFPDRFCRSRLPQPEGLVGARTVHESWEDTPDYLPDEKGEIRNCDFFGGDFRGITEKLDYLQSLSVTTLYLNPIFEAASNHRYNTADYRAVDPMLGTEEDFRELCRQAHKRGMRLLLDGVFNHTGSVSRYFNRDGFYPELGAAQSQASPYYNWYHFTRWPEEYDAWWGIKTLPAVDEGQDSYRAFIIRDRDSVVRRWLRSGADGWRLDVADELPDDFIREIRRAMEEEKPDAVLIGEVWEDGSNKIAYDRRRRYLLGRETHGLMNYPFRTAAIDWLLGGDAAAFREWMEELRENYPSPAFYCAMNFLGTHDTARILTLLAGEPVPESRSQRAAACLSPAGYRRAAAAGGAAPLCLPRLSHGVLRGRGRDAGLRGSPEPPHLSLGPGGRRPFGLVSAAGAGAPGAALPANRLPALSFCPRGRPGAGAPGRKGCDRGGPERRRGGPGADPSLGRGRSHGCHVRAAVFGGGGPGASDPAGLEWCAAGVRLFDTLTPGDVSHETLPGFAKCFT